MMRPVTTRAEYMALRGSNEQQQLMAAIRSGNETLKHRLVQMNYSCLPNADGTLRGSTRMSNTVGMDIDHLKAEEMPAVRDRILDKKDELGLGMLEESARGCGYHLVFTRRPHMSQVENLQWAAQLLGVDYDAQAKDITRVFFTTGTEQLIYLDDSIFSSEEVLGTREESLGTDDTAFLKKDTAVINEKEQCLSKREPCNPCLKRLPTLQVQKQILAMADEIVGTGLRMLNEPAEDTLTATQVAKTFNMNTRDFNAVLADMNIQYRAHGRWHLAEHLLGRGYTAERTHIDYSLKGKRKIKVYMTWTMAGLKYLNSQLGYPNL